MPRASNVFVVPAGAAHILPLVKAIKLIILLAVLGGVAWFLWTKFFPSPDRVIRKRVGELARVASFGPGEGELAKMANAAEVAGFFTKDVEILVDVPGYQRQSFTGREHLFQAATAVRMRLQGLSVEFLDVNVTVGPDRKSARLNLTGKANIPGEKDFMVQELEFHMVRDGRDWFIRRVATMRTLN